MKYCSNVLAPGLRGSGHSPSRVLFLCGVCAYFLLLPVRTDSTVTVLVMTALALWAGKAGNVLRTLRAAPARIPLAAFAFFVCIALVASLANPATLGKFPRILLWACCVFSGVMLSACLPEQEGGYFWALFAGIGGSCVAAAVMGYDSPDFWHDGRLKLFAIHPSRLGLYCAACFFFLLHRSVAASGRARLLPVAASLFALFLLIQTNTRGNILMLPLGVACFAATLSRRHWKRLGPALLVCVLLTGGAVWMSKESVAGKRLVSAVTNITRDGTFRSRLPIWEAGWESFKANPFIGHGYQGYRDAHARYREEHAADWDVRYQGNYEHNVKQAHNIVLGRLVETGILGTLAFLVFYGGAIVAAWRGPESRRWLVAPLVFYLAMNMVDDGLFRMNDAFILFVAGTALCSGGRAENEAIGKDIA